MTSERTFIERPPRIQPELPQQIIDIPSPPDQRDQGLGELMHIALPLLMIVGYIMVAFMGDGNSNPLLIVPMALSIVASTLFSWITYREEKQKRADEAAVYQEQLHDLRRDMNTAHEAQRHFYRHNAPDAAETVQIVLDTVLPPNARITETRAGTRLWERRPDDDDFATLRLGIGTRPSTAVYKAPQADGIPTRLGQEAQRLADDSQFVNQIPITLPLRRLPEKDEEAADASPTTNDQPIPPTIHSLGIAGEARDVYPFANVLISQYTTLHSPHDARLFVLGSHSQPWEWLMALPHAEADDQGDAVCFLDLLPETVVTTHEDETGLPRYLEQLRKRLTTRRLRLKENEKEDTQQDDENPTRPFLLLMVDLLNVPDGSPLGTIEADATIAILQQAGAELGAAVIFLVPQRSQIPADCTAVIEIDNGAGTPVFRYAETGVNTLRYVGTAEMAADQRQLHAFSSAMSRWDVRKSSSGNLTKVAPFLEMLGEESLQTLRESTRQNWAYSTQPERIQPLRVRVGYMAGNKPRSLVFSAKRDGVHGMVAGSTGSGKSELLISMIAALAVNYDPTMLNFVLVDYKGGGAFQEFAQLPHCVDVITNLQKAGVSRMFTAVHAEMKRRQQLNAATDTKDILEYHRKGYHLSHEPYPYLFIIIDEFAEMIAGNTQFKNELDMITRLGRAQGISLLLAAQRPTGISDQMRANIKFRICLRVETPGESREMLRRTDAAFLPGNIPGRGYLQVGNEDIDLIQVAYSGDSYRDPAANNEPDILWPQRQPELLHDAAQEPEPPKLYQAVVSMVQALAEEASITPQRAPWPDSLSHPQTLTAPLSTIEYLANTALLTHGREEAAVAALNPWLRDWLNGRSQWPALDWRSTVMRPVVGLVDNPYEAQQQPLVVNLRRGHAVLFGASGWGKTVLLRSLVASLAATHPPNALHIYLLDLGGRNLAALDKLPQVGAVIMPDEEGFEERVAYLLRELAHLVESRKLLLNQHGVEDVYQYNTLHPAEPLPVILLGIDNFAEFIELFGSSQDNVSTNLDALTALARQCRPYGVHFMVTTRLPGDLPGKLSSLFSEQLTLRQPDAAIYREILGTAVPDIEELEGRGFIKDGNQPLVFQAGLLVEPDPSASGINADLQAIYQLAEAMQKAGSWEGTGPMVIGALPKTVSYLQMMGLQTARPREGLEAVPPHLKLQQKMAENWARSRDPEGANWLSATLGIVAGNQPRTLHFSAPRDGVHGMIAGGTGSGKSEMLMTLIVDMAFKHDPSILNFVLVDYKGGGAFKPFEKLPHVVDSVTNLNSAAVSRMFVAINAEMKRRQQLNADTGVKDIVDYRRKGYHLTQAPYPHLFIIIDEYAEMIVDKPEFKEELDRITRVGRSLGISLILASQKPIGVSDQMRANIKFRLCLRVEGVDTSREMLRRSDAAYLPSGMPGRGYLQIGNDNLELIQVAYTGETTATAQNEKTKLYSLVVDTAHYLIADQRQPQCPWPPMLPDGRSATFNLTSSLDPHYIPATHHSRLQADDSTILSSNPAIAAWLNGQTTWPGVDWQQTALRPVIGLVDNPQQACQLPLTLNLARGHLALLGASGMGKTTALRTLVYCLAATHSPAELNIIILDLGGRQLRLLQALPHVGSVLLPDEAGFAERVHQLVRELNHLVEQRQRQMSDSGAPDFFRYNQQASQPLPAVLVLIDNYAEFQELFAEGGETVEKMMSDLQTLIRQARTYGIHFVVTASDAGHIPGKLLNLFSERLVLRLGGDADYQSVLGQRVAELPDVPGLGYTLVEDVPLVCQIALPLPETAASSDIKTLQAALEAGEWQGQPPLSVEPLPRACLYRPLLAEVFGMDEERPFLSELERITAQNWAKSIDPDQADWLTALLGVASGNHPRSLHFSAPADGVHGLVAGGTGSGKSELLTTLIAGMAVQYDPSVLNFVLVDYKGGGAFKPFEKLPHCVDIITNLNQSAVTRMFTAINAEVRRRQQLNADTGVKDIVDYRRRGYHLSKEPYPHLFIIIDEYAEMIADNRDYLQELESITRVGRSLGISLILASQRPTGVTDQMRSNIKFRICLRVEGADESRELLRVPDAANLPNGMPGRGYLQIGNDELYLMQMAYTGDSYPEAQQPDDTEAPKLFDVIVRLAARLAQQPDAPTRRARPWPDFLPEAFGLADELTADYLQQGEKAVPTAFQCSPPLTAWQKSERPSWSATPWNGETFAPVLGLIDNPYQACQHPLRLHLMRDHLLLFGGSGFGKTSFLRALMVDLTTSYSPEVLHLFVLDLGGRSFGSLRHLPHVADVIMPDDLAYEERLTRLLERLNRELQRRKQLFSDTDARDLIQYNRQHGERPLPLQLILIDNFAELKENFEMLVDEQLVPLLRQGRPYGLSFVITANAPGAIPGKLHNLLGRRLTFTLADAGHYLDIVGRSAPPLEPIPGRGLVRVGKRPLTFQAALPFGNEAQGEDVQLRQLAETLKASWAGLTPEPIYILPNEVTLQSVLARLPEDASGEFRFVLGLNNDLQPAIGNLERFGPHFGILGPPLSGKTTALTNIALSLAVLHSPEAVALVFIDLNRKFIQAGGDRALTDLPHRVATLTNLAQLPLLVERIKGHCQSLALGENGRRLFVLIENFDDLCEEIENNREAEEALNELAVLTGRHGADGLHIILAGALEAPQPLKKRVLASGYGLGLRDADSLTTLRAYTRGFADLPAGRGHLVSGGLPTKVQVAQPFALPHGRTAGLDTWVAQIQSQFEDFELEDWLAGEEVGEGETAVSTGQPSASNGTTAVDLAVAAQALTLLKTAIAYKSEADGVPLASLGLDLASLPDDDVLRMAETYFE